MLVQQLNRLPGSISGSFRQVLDQLWDRDWSWLFIMGKQDISDYHWKYSCGQSQTVKNKGKKSTVLFRISSEEVSENLKKFKFLYITTL